MTGWVVRPSHPLVGRAHNPPPLRAVSHGGQYRTSRKFIQIFPHRRMYPRLGLAPELPDATPARARLKDRADAAQPTAQTTQQCQVNAIDSTATRALCICRRRQLTGASAVIMTGPPGPAVTARERLGRPLGSGGTALEVTLPLQQRGHLSTATARTPESSVSTPGHACRGS